MKLVMSSAICFPALADCFGRIVQSKPVMICNLEALAHFGNGPLRAPILDARRGDVYGAVYDASGGIVVPELVAKLPVWLATLPVAALVSVFLTSWGTPPLVPTGATPRQRHPARKPSGPAYPTLSRAAPRISSI